MSNLVGNPVFLDCSSYKKLKSILFHLFYSRVWFSVIGEEGSSEFVSELVPVLLERTGLLFGIEGYKDDIRR